MCEQKEAFERADFFSIWGFSRLTETCAMNKEAQRDCCGGGGGGGDGGENGCGEGVISSHTALSLDVRQH